MKPGPVPLGKENRVKFCIDTDKDIKEWLDKTSGKRGRSSKINKILRLKMDEEINSGLYKITVETNDVQAQADVLQV